jgi:8-oxo-dGTP diphosphatase
VIRNNPLTGEGDLDEALKTFLKQIGYLPENTDDDIGSRLIRDCFLAYPNKPWTVDELLTYLEANKSTLYRYLNKLKGLDLVEEEVIPLEMPAEGPSKKTRKGYKIRHSSISLAWTMVESHAAVAMENYRKSVDHLEKLAKKRIKGEGGSQRRIPSLTVDGLITRVSGGKKEVLLVKRANDPFKDHWALPGGFVDYGEMTEKAVIREIKEETGMDCKIKGLFKVASDPSRDPRGHTVTVVYLMEPTGKKVPEPGDDAAEVAWFSMDSLPKLAFDHLDIVGQLND